MKAIFTGQSESSRLMRLIALGCVVLALFISGLEAMHAHSDAAVSRNSPPCAICLSAHANAPAITVHVLPQMQAVEAIAVSPQFESKSAATELLLFIRPPPSA
jgi:hypothetical protein